MAFAGRNSLIAAYASRAVKGLFGGEGRFGLVIQTESLTPL
jgi:hypothetical protein